MRICYNLWRSPLPGNSLTANRTNNACAQSEEQHIRYNHNPIDSTHTRVTETKSSDTLLSESAIKLIIERRKKVIKLLVTIVLAFALFCAPFHARKLAQHFVQSYEVDSNYATVFTIFTTLLLYSNSGINPIIYVIFSTKLRGLMLDAIIRLLKTTRLFSTGQLVWQIFTATSADDDYTVSTGNNIDNNTNTNSRNVSVKYDSYIKSTTDTKTSKRTDV